VPESGDNIFVIHQSSNHDYENFTIGSYQVESGRVSGHLVSGQFRFRVVSSRVGSSIESYSVGSFRVSGRIRLGWIGYRVILNFCLYQTGSGIGLFSVGSFRVLNRIESRRIEQISRIGSDYVTFTHENKILPLDLM
jgi:hypothetical protein